MTHRPNELDPGPGKLEDVTLNPFRRKRRKQALIFELATTLTLEYLAYGDSELSPHVLFPQLTKIVGRYLDEKVIVRPPADLMDVFLSPYYGWVIENMVQAIRLDISKGEAPEVPKYERHRKPSATDEVDFWTSREVREVVHSHLNYIVADKKNGNNLRPISLTRIRKALENIKSESGQNRGLSQGRVERKGAE
jgi:type III restriction enzyme